MSCVPFPWCTSQSMMAMRDKPFAMASAAATATLLSRQKPMPFARVAWWPGGRKRARPGGGAAPFLVFFGSRMASTSAMDAPAARFAAATDVGAR